MNKITKIEAKEIKDSRNNPTILVSVFVGEKVGSFAVPSGASTGKNEAHELRDDDKKGVNKALEKINNIIAPNLIGQNIFNQEGIDDFLIKLDGTKNKSNLGGNSIIGVSIACVKVAAQISNMEVFEYLRTIYKIKPSRRIPYLFMNLINGGKHAKTELSFQEYHIVPDVSDVNEAISIGVKIQETLKEMILEDLGEESVILGDEGGFAPKINNVFKPLEYFKEAIKKNNLEGKVKFALDVAASSFFKDNLYNVGGVDISKNELMNVYNSILNDFDILSIEDPFFEEDFESFRNLRKDNAKIFVVGDDLTVTNSALVEKAVKEQSINAMIIKPNQIGTLSETLKTMKEARDNNIELIVSHRSGETNDDFIADLAYAFGCFGLKSGAPLKPERKVKYDRLIEISSK